jgi:hypothetical protein
VHSSINEMVELWEAANDRNYGETGALKGKLVGIS